MADNQTHHLVPNLRGIYVCRYCKRADVSTGQPCSKAAR